jgi:hypothetical protein
LLDDRSPKTGSRSKLGITSHMAGAPTATTKIVIEDAWIVGT